MIGAYTTDKITFSKDTVDKWGQVTATATAIAKCRVNRKRKRIVDFKGDEIISEYSLSIKRLDQPGLTIDITTRAQVDGQAWPIRAIREPKDFSWGFFEVYL
jgi:hypothetical protein